jgi:hypothetical protein
MFGAAEMFENTCKIIARIYSPRTQQYKPQDKKKIWGIIVWIGRGLLNCEKDGFFLFFVNPFK